MKNWIRILCMMVVVLEDVSEVAAFHRKLRDDSLKQLEKFSYSRNISISQLRQTRYSRDVSSQSEQLRSFNDIPTSQIWQARHSRDIPSQNGQFRHPKNIPASQFWQARYSRDVSNQSGQLRHHRDISTSQLRRARYSRGVLNKVNHFRDLKNTTASQLGQIKYSKNVWSPMSEFRHHKDIPANQLSRYSRDVSSQSEQFRLSRGVSTSQLWQARYARDVSSQLDQLKHHRGTPASHPRQTRHSRNVSSQLGQFRHPRHILASESEQYRYFKNILDTSDYMGSVSSRVTASSSEVTQNANSATVQINEEPESQGEVTTSSLRDVDSFTTITPPDLQEMVNIIQDEAESLNLTSDGNLHSQEMIQAMLGLRWDRVLKRLLANKRLDVLFPRPSNINANCYKNLLDFIHGLVGVADDAGDLVTEDWALQMLDAFGKPSAGLLQGVFQWVGNYEECLNTHARIKLPRYYTDDVTNDTTHFGGRYCRVLLNVGHIVKVALAENVNQFWHQKPTFPVVVNWGVCIPDSCSSNDVVSFLSKGTLATLDMPIRTAVCFEESRFSDDSAAITTVFILCIFIVLVTTCTSLDIYYYRPWLSNNVRKETVRRKDTDGVADLQEMQPRIAELRNDATHCPSSNKSAADATSREQNGQDVHSSKQTTLKSAGCLDKNTIPTDAEDAKKQGLMGWQSMVAKTGTLQSQTESAATENQVTRCVITAREGNNLEAGSRDAIQPGRSFVSRSKGIGQQIIQGISLYRNLYCLLHKTGSHDTIDCIQGMRVISLAWIIVGHCYTYGGMLDETNLIFENSAELVETSARLSFHIVGSAHLAVDTFFLISGCLSMLSTLRLLRKNKSGMKFWSMFLFHRFWRLTPLYMVVMLVGTTLYDHLVQGPLKSSKLAEFEQCKQKWWSHLLYINNFYRPYSKCMTWSWFIAVDMQLFVISPIFIYTIHRNMKVGIGLIISLLVFGIASAFVSEYVHGGQFVLMDLSFLDYWSYVYTMPWARASVFSIGLLLGVILYNKVGRACLSKRRSYCVWVVVATVSVFLVLINHNQWKHDSQNWTRVQQAFYESLVRPGWALCMAWVIFASSSGLGGYANVILGWRPFLVLSRLTYSLYLLHPMVIMFVVYSRRTPIYLDPANLSLVYNYMGNMIFTFLLGAIFSLLFEMPMAAMESILLRNS